MAEFFDFLPPGLFADLLSAAVPAIVSGLGLGFAFALLGLLISVPVRFVTKGAH